MAFLYNESFIPGSGELPGIVDDKNFFFKRIKMILLDISGPPVITSYGDLYPRVPHALRTGRDGLKRNWKKIWEDTIFAFDFSTYGASANHTTLEINIGEFFLRQEVTTLDLKKVVWHELLHLLIDAPRMMHHGQINKIIKHHLKLKGDPNPFGTEVE